MRFTCKRAGNSIAASQISSQLPTLLNNNQFSAKEYVRNQKKNEVKRRKNNSVDM